jgi:hypothetical protein
MKKSIRRVQDEAQSRPIGAQIRSPTPLPSPPVALPPWPGPLAVACRSASRTGRGGPPPARAGRRPKLATTAATPRALPGNVPAAEAEEAHEGSPSGARGRTPRFGATPPHEGRGRAWKGKDVAGGESGRRLGLWSGERGRELSPL